jgi:DNA-binding protein HU-beta
MPSGGIINMNKVELVEKATEALEGFKKKEVEAVLEALIATIEDTVAIGEKVSLVGFGTFEKVETKGREGVCRLEAAKGKTWKTEDGFKPKFTPGKRFKEKTDK